MKAYLVTTAAVFQNSHQARSQSTRRYASKRPR